MQKTQNTPPSASLVWPALQVGALTGASGFVVGGAAGVIRNSPPALFATASGLQWFALGTTFWGTRGFILQAWNTGNLTSEDRRNASTIAGGVAGSGVALLARGPRNVIPGGIMFSLFGFAGQSLYNYLDAQHSAVATQPKENFMQRLAKKKWSPMSVLSDEDYEAMLQEKMLRLDVDISLLDDRIAQLKKQMQNSQNAGD